MDETRKRASAGDYERLLCEPIAQFYGLCETRGESRETETSETEELDLSEHVCNACL